MKIINETSDADKIKYLKEESVLFQSLLSGDEIRYTDVIAYFCKNFNRNPFIENCPLIELNKDEIELKVHREKKHTDLWIGKIKNKNYTNVKHPTYELPEILVENKLKSLPYEKQLIDYSIEFASRYFEAFKEEKRKKEGETIKINEKGDLKKQLKDRLENLHLYLLTPTNEHDIINPIKGEITIGKKNKKHIVFNFEFNWKFVDFATLGNNINCFIESLGESIDDYRKTFWEDFSNILICFSSLSTKITKLSVDDLIIDAFTTEEYFENLGLEDLYSKYRASQCANHLHHRLIGKAKYLGLKQPKILREEDISIDSIVVSSGYSNSGGGLFEIARKITNEISLIIQFQNNELRKGLVIKKQEAHHYDGWFKDEWTFQDGLIFGFTTKKEAKKKKSKITDEDIYNHFSTDDEYTMYYSVFRIGNDGNTITVDKILTVMKTITEKDTPEKRTNLKRRKID